MIIQFNTAAKINLTGDRETIKCYTISKIDNGIDMEVIGYSVVKAGEMAFKHLGELEADILSCLKLPHG